MIERAALVPVAPLDSPVLGNRAATPAQGDFANVLLNAIYEVEASSANAAQATQAFLSGSEADIHSVALAAQRASLQFEYFLQVRNKVVQAYQEVMRMQL